MDTGLQWKLKAQDEDDDDYGYESRAVICNFRFLGLAVSLKMVTPTYSETFNHLNAKRGKYGGWRYHACSLICQFQVQKLCRP
jgi:hypothetical protein